MTRKSKRTLNYPYLLEKDVESKKIVEELTQKQSKLQKLFNLPEIVYVSVIIPIISVTSHVLKYVLGESETTFLETPSQTFNHYRDQVYIEKTEPTLSCRSFRGSDQSAWDVCPWKCEKR